MTAGDRLLEDRRVGGQSPDADLVDRPLQLPAQQHVPTDVILPNALPFAQQCLDRVLAHLTPPSSGTRHEAGALWAADETVLHLDSPTPRLLTHASCLVPRASLR